MVNKNSYFSHFPHHSLTDRCRWSLVHFICVTFLKMRENFFMVKKMPRRRKFILSCLVLSVIQSSSNAAYDHPYDSYHDSGDHFPYGFPPDPLHLPSPGDLRIPWGSSGWYSVATLRPAQAYSSPISTTPSPPPSTAGSSLSRSGASYCDCRAEIQEAIREIEKEGPPTRPPRRTTPYSQTDDDVGSGQQEQDYDDLDGRIGGGQQTLESRKRARIEMHRTVGSSSTPIPYHSSSLEFLCEKYTEFNKERFHTNNRDNTVDNGIRNSIVSGGRVMRGRKRKSQWDDMEKKELSYVNLLPLPLHDESSDDSVTYTVRSTPSPSYTSLMTTPFREREDEASRRFRPPPPLSDDEPPPPPSAMIAGVKGKKGGGGGKGTSDGKGGSKRPLTPESPGTKKKKGKVPQKNTQFSSYQLQSSTTTTKTPTPTTDPTPVYIHDYTPTYHNNGSIGSIAENIRKKNRNYVSSILNYKNNRKKTNDGVKGG